MQRHCPPKALVCPGVLLKLRRYQATVPDPHRWGSVHRVAPAGRAGRFSASLPCALGLVGVVRRLRHNDLGELLALWPANYCCFGVRRGDDARAREQAA